MIVYEILATIGVIFYIIYRKIKNVYTFWEKKGVNGPKPVWLVGNALPVLRKEESINSLTHKIYDMYPKEKVVGIYLGETPTLILKDLNLVRKVLIKDFASFADRGLKTTKNIFSDSIFLEKGEKWKVYRQKLNPLFSTGSMKNIFGNVEEHILEYLSYIENLPTGPKDLRMLDHKFSLKLLMSYLFGLKINNYNEEIGNLERVVNDVSQLKIRDIIYIILHGYNPDLPSDFGVQSVLINLEKNVEMIINETKNSRKDNLHHDKTFFDFMVKLKEQGFVTKEKRDGVVKVEISDSVLAAHVAVFYASAFESFINYSFLLFELALNLQIQERCYKEIVQVLENYDGDLTFEAIEDMQYLNMAFDECLRKYPTGGHLIRTAIKDYHFEDIDLTIEKNTKVIVPVPAIHYDARYFPNPEVFDPERFSLENKKKIPDCSYLPFGDGPRKCLGSRLTRFQSILLIARFLHKFKVTPCEKTVSKIRFSPLQAPIGVGITVLQLPPNELWVNITKRQ